MPTGGRDDPYWDSSFIVEIDGVSTTGFSQVLMPEAYADVIEYREGTDSLTIRKLPGLRHFTNLVLKRGITQDQALYDWWKKVSQGQVERKSISVVLLDENRGQVVRWNFREAWPVRYKPGDLNGNGKEALVETFEITFEGMDRETV